MLSNRIGRWTLIALAGLVFTVGCRSSKTDRIRYLAGYDAEAFLAMRSGKSDEEYIATVREQFGI